MRGSEVDPGRQAGKPERAHSGVVAEAEAQQDVALVAEAAQSQGRGRRAEPAGVRIQPREGVHGPVLAGLPTVGERELPAAGVRAAAAALRLSRFGDEGDVLLGLGLGYDAAMGAFWLPSLAARVYF